MFDDLPDGDYTVSYSNTSIYTPYASNTGTINGLPVGATSGLQTLISITLSG